MSELRDRMKIEGDMARKLSKLSSLQRAEMRQIMGDPPDPEKITAADWDRWQREREQQLATLLLAVYIATANQHVEEQIGKNPPPQDAQSAMVMKAVNSTVRQAQEAAAANMGSAREVMQSAARAWKSLPPSRESVEQVMAQAIGPTRDAATAATEVTRAAIGGTNAAMPVLQSVGVNMTQRWYTMEDPRVCPFCRPLHLKVPDLWIPVVRTVIVANPKQLEKREQAIQWITGNEGPPAHPICRCWLETHPEKTATRVRR